MGNTGDLYGYVKLLRKIVNWEWYQDIPTKVLFIHFLMIANWKEMTFKGAKIHRGELLRTLHKLSTETGLTIAQVRTAISHLLSTNDITERYVGNVRVIRVSNYGKYQDNTNNSTDLAQESHEESQPDRTDSSTQIAHESHRVKNNKERVEGKKEKAASAGNETPAPIEDEDDGGWMNADELVLQIQS